MASALSARVTAAIGRSTSRSVVISTTTTNSTASPATPHRLQASRAAAREMASASCEKAPLKARSRLNRCVLMASTLGAIFCFMITASMRQRSLS